MRLIPLEHEIPVLYSTEEHSDPLCIIKLFTPDANWTWYIIEIDDKEELCFGYVVGMEKELGYFAMSDLKAIRGALGLPVERDMSFVPIPLSEVKERHHD